MTKLVSLASIFLFALVLQSCGPSLYETGIPTEGTIISKRDIGLGTSRRCYITVNFFTQPDKEDPKPEKKKDTNPTIDEIIESLSIDVRIGNYETAEIQVTNGAYDDYKEGQRLPIRYEKGNPSNAVIDQ